jgi:hypothetical protein
MDRMNDKQIEEMPSDQRKMMKSSILSSNWTQYSKEDDQASAIKKSYEEHLKKLDKKFETALEEIKQMKERPEAFKQHQLPLARIKKIMKSDEDVKVFLGSNF